MSHFRPDSELHKRRSGRNFAVAACLVALIAVLVTLSIVKMQSVGAVEGFDHAVRPALVPEE